MEATLLEVLRKADIAPLSFSHGLARDVTFHGYGIPQDAIIIPNLSTVLQDPEIWGDPENFRPERFIGPDGKLARPEEFIPFGTGRKKKKTKKKNAGVTGYHSKIVYESFTLYRLGIVTRVQVAFLQVAWTSGPFICLFV